jgi:hypothetical protein
LLSTIKMLPNTKDVTLVLDATGCGGPFLDLLRKQPIGAHTMPVIITGSGLPSVQGGNYRISKTDLMKSLNYLVSSPDFKINAPAEHQQMAFALAAWPARKHLAARGNGA